MLVLYQVLMSLLICVPRWCVPCLHLLCVDDVLSITYGCAWCIFFRFTGLTMLMFTPLSCADCGISSSLAACVMIYVTAVQLNLHSQGPPVWRLSTTKGLWYEWFSSPTAWLWREEQVGTHILALFLPSVQRGVLMMMYQDVLWRLRMWLLLKSHKLHIFQEFQ